MKLLLTIKTTGIYALNRPDLDNRDTVKVAQYIEHEGWDPVTDFNGKNLQNLKCLKTPAFNSYLLI